MRQLRGPAAPGDRPTLTLVEVRRFKCQRCEAVLTVVPAETLCRRLYSAAVIAWALALYGLSMLAPAAVRERVSPWSFVGHASVTRWRTLSRWCSATASGRLFTKLRPLDNVGRREVARAAAISLSAFAVPTTDPPAMPVLAFHGAARAV